MQLPQHIVITGASSGIGESLARAYARAGIRIGLLGRRKDKLDAIAASLASTGAQIWVGVVDVTQQDNLKAMLIKADEEKPIDLLIANAGISAGTFGAGESEQQARAIFGTNLDGVLNTIHPIIPRMQNRRSGQIAIMASLAGFRGFPSAPAYCASKAAVRLYGEALRGEYAKWGIKINVICPGYIETPMTAVNDFPMPFMMDATKAAHIIVKGLARNEARIAFPWPTAFAAWLLGVLPPSWTDPLLTKLPKKPAFKQ
ncbi:MAG: SDR family NAD(P)-dependent oxidoreductase [Alphaproteobacteria bacterium]|nr:SDR family NAD(P)-dependent oxidoreductase [Alphaproteobacteria bacterium]